MLGIIVLIYILSIQVTYSEITKKEKQIFKKLKIDGFRVDNERKIKNIFRLFKFLPISNIYVSSFLKNNFDLTYRELKDKFIKKELIFETPILSYVNSEIKKLEEYEYNIIKNDDLPRKIKYLEKRKNKELFRGIDYLDMNFEIQNELLNDLINKIEVKKVNEKNQKNSDDKILYFNNMKNFINTDEKVIQKVKH